MFHPPSSFSSGTSHRLVHFFDQQLESDHERIEDILADVARCVRGAIEALDDMPFQGGEFWRHNLVAKAIPGKFLDEDFRNAARRALQALAAQDPEPAPATHDRASRLLRDALEHSHRVAELLAAEYEIAEYRSRNG